LRSFKRTTRLKALNLFSILLLVSSLIITALPGNGLQASVISAEGNDDNGHDYEEGHGSIKNEDGEIDYG